MDTISSGASSHSWSLVPGFNPMIPIQAPIWSEVVDIFSFAQDYLLFFCLQAKLNFNYNGTEQNRTT
jgi:hypothetical protein